MVPFDNNETEPPNTDKTVGTTCLSNSSAAANNDLPLDTAIDMENFSPLSTDIFADIIDLNGGIDWKRLLFRFSEFMTMGSGCTL
ncbi:hypothetical protein NUH16_008102 [Penicillium rubens]|nr:hypothetical protein NUH16_008102 [Penicillium rubens]